MPLCYLSAYKYTRILWILQAKKHVFVKKVCSLPFCPKVCYNDTGLLGRKEERNLSILRTIALFVYLFGYMIVHYATLRRAERALAAGDLDTVEQIVKANIPRWSRASCMSRGPGWQWKGGRISRRGPVCSWATTAATTTSRFCWPVWISPTASLPRKSWKRSRC